MIRAYKLLTSPHPCTSPLNATKLNIIITTLTNQRDHLSLLPIKVPSTVSICSTFMPNSHQNRQRMIHSARLNFKDIFSFTHISIYEHIPRNVKIQIDSMHYHHMIQ